MGDGGLRGRMGKIGGRGREKEEDLARWVLSRSSKFKLFAFLLSCQDKL